MTELSACSPLSRMKMKSTFRSKSGPKRRRYRIAKNWGCATGLYKFFPKKLTLNISEVTNESYGWASVTQVRKRLGRILWILV